MASVVRLIGDIGGTNARFAVARDGDYQHIESHPGTDYDSFEAAIADYLKSLPGDVKPTEAAFAFAGPVEGDKVALTNHPWSFSKQSLQARFKLDRLMIYNDFTANALGLPYLQPSDFEQIGGGRAKKPAPIGILGPGTGLGVSGLVPTADGQWTPLQGEGGHVTLAPSDEREGRVVELLRQRFGHVSAERALSGDGLVNLYETLCQIEGVPSAAYKPAQITDETIGQTDPHCRMALTMFCSMLGTVAGSLALTLGAFGGVFIAGGIIPRLGSRFATSPFRERFEAMGRFHSYMAAIPTFVITHRNPALVGLAHLP